MFARRAVMCPRSGHKRATTRRLYTDEQFTAAVKAYQKAGILTLKFSITGFLE